MVYHIPLEANILGYVISDSKITVAPNNENEGLNITNRERNVLEGNVISTGLFSWDSPGFKRLLQLHKLTFQPLKGWGIYNTGTFSENP
jgi:hypothetical protein